MFEHYYAVIMAGGEGSRLWPLSRQNRPKQMVQLGSNRTLFQVAVDRIRDLFPPERIYVVTVASQAESLKNQCPEIPTENYLLEPMPRGTASVAGLAAVALRARDPQAVMVILAADHLIQNEVFFRQLLQDGKGLAEQGYLVTLGIRPTYPATGYGYIQRGELIDSAGCLAYQVKRFKEKPDEDSARLFLLQGDHEWNSGMFVWTLERIFQEIGALMPDLLEKLDAIARDWDTPSRSEVVQSIWPTIQPQTIDYGIMEKAGRVAVIPALDLGWNDVGSWESIFEVFQPDGEGNIILESDHMGLGTSNSLVVSDRAERLIVTVGLDNVIIVDTQDAVLVCARKDAQRVREVVSLLKKGEETRRYL